MNKKLVIRSVALLLSIVVLYAGYSWLKEWTKDPDRGSLDSTDMVAAVEYVGEGSQIVLFDANGKKTVVPGVVEGRMDVDPTWRPDGQRVFFSSNREGTSNDIFRWNIATNDVEPRLSGSRSAGSPHFGPSGWPNLADSGLILLGGNVFDFNQREKLTKQLLPPLSFANSGESAAGQMETMYERIGKSFKVAKWGRDRKVMYTVMRREDDEVFVINYMEPMGEQQVGPMPIFAGHSIQLDVAPDGTAIVAIQGFEFVDQSQIPPELIVNGVATKPWRNGLFAINVQDDATIDAVPLFIDQADIGVDAQAMTPELRSQHGIPANVSGAVVLHVSPGSAGELLKMAVGDVLMSVNGQKIESYETMVLALSQVRLGVDAQVEFWSKSDGAVKKVPYAFGKESSMALRDPSASPDSTMVAVVVGMALDRYNFEAIQLILVPIKQMGINEARRLITGRIFEPNWHPSGKKLVYAKVGPSGDSQIYVIGADGSGERNLSGAGEYGSPRFSPMVKN